MKENFISYGDDCLHAKATLAPCISFSKSGLIRFNGRAVELLTLREGDQVKFFQNKRLPKEWYLAIVKKEGIPIRNTSSVQGRNVLALNSSFIVRTMQKSLELSSDISITVPVGVAPDENGWWSLITSAYKKAKLV